MLSKNLELAFARRDANSVKRLVDSQLFRSGDIEQCFYLAVKLNYRLVLQSLLKKPQLQDRIGLLSAGILSCVLDGNLTLISFLMHKLVSAIGSAQQDTVVILQPLAKKMAEDAINFNQIGILNYLYDNPIFNVSPTVSDLEHAIKSGQVEIVKLLLSKNIRSSCFTAREGFTSSDVLGVYVRGKKSIPSLVEATIRLVESSQDLSLVYLLLKGDIHLPTYGRAFMSIATASEDLTLIQLLTDNGVPLCRRDFKSDNILSAALLAGHIELFKRMVECGLNVSANQSIVLSHAVALGELELVQFCIRHGADPRVGSHDSAFIQAIYLAQPEILEYLCQNHLMPFNQDTLVILQFMAISDSAQIKLLCRKLMSQYGFKPVNFDSTDHSTAVFESVANGPVPYTSIAGEKVRAQLLASRIDKHFSLSSTESAMQSMFVAQARHHFSQVIQPTFARQFQALGGLKEIECRIKLYILRAVYQDTRFLDDKTQARKIQQYISDHHVSIIDGNPKNRQAFLELIGNNNEFTAFVAWRAYESLAATDAFVSLLVEPDPLSKSDTVFSISAVRESGEAESIDLDKASSYIRHLIAYCYLVAKEHNCLEDLVYALFEIQRAHNPDLTGVDSPSCFPGAITRGIMSLHKTPFALPQNAVLQIREYMKNFIVGNFRRALNDKTFMGTINEDSASFLLDSLVGLHSEYTDVQVAKSTENSIAQGGKDIVLLSGEKGYSLEHLFLRKQFVQYYLNNNIDDLLQDLLRKLQVSGVPSEILSDPMIGLVVEHAFIELSHHGALPSILDIYWKFQKTFIDDAFFHHDAVSDDSISCESDDELPLVITRISNSLSNRRAESNPFVQKPFEEWFRVLSGDERGATLIMYVQNLKHKLYELLRPILPECTQQNVAGFINSLYAYNKDLNPPEIAQKRFVIHAELLRENNIIVSPERIILLNNALKQEFDRKPSFINQQETASFYPAQAMPSQLLKYV